MDNKTRLKKIAELWKLIASLRIQLSLLDKNPKTLTPLLRRKSEQLIAEMEKKGFKVMVHQSFRSKEEQDYLYAQGRTRPGAIVTNARGGESLHNYGVAFDMVFISDGKPSWSNNHPWSILGETGKSIGLEWGGDWKTFVDRPHFQLLRGYTLDSFKSNIVDYNHFN